MWMLDFLLGKNRMIVSDSSDWSQIFRDTRGSLEWSPRYKCWCERVNGYLTPRRSSWYVELAGFFRY